MVVIHVPTRHFYSPYATKTILLHLLPTSSKVRSSMQSSLTPIGDQSSLEVMICAFLTILMLINQTAILERRINFPLVMSMTVNKQITFLLVSTNS
jgi:hypothetical protein